MEAHIRSYLSLSMRVMTLTLVLLVARVLAAMLTGFSTSTAGDVKAPAGSGAEVLLILFVVSFLECVAWVYPIRRSMWTGWRLAFGVFAVTFGTMTLQPQIEAIYFGVLEIETSLRVLLMGIVTSALFAPAAVWLLGRWRLAYAGQLQGPTWPAMATREWIVKLAAAGVLYVILYAFFGHFVAWQSTEVRTFYGGSATGGGLANVGMIAIPSLGPLQFLRGLLWAALGIPVLRLMTTNWWKAGLALGALFALVMNAQLLIPNPYMPVGVRLIHLVETSASNLLFGFGIAWLFRHAISARRSSRPGTAPTEVIVASRTSWRF